MNRKKQGYERKRKKRETTERKKREELGGAGKRRRREKMQGKIINKKKLVEVRQGKIAIAFEYPLTHGKDRVGWDREKEKRRGARE